MLSLTPVDGVKGWILLKKGLNYLSSKLLPQYEMELHYI